MTLLVCLKVFFFSFLACLMAMATCLIGDRYKEGYLRRSTAGPSVLGEFACVQDVDDQVYFFSLFSGVCYAA